jgi:outer membrane immunogenic protein
MKKLATAVAAIALIGTPAFAQAPPAPVSSWTGWYAGVNAGASFGRAKTDFNDATTLTDSVMIGLSSGTGTSTFGFADSDTSYPAGFIGGGQIGYNWQFSPIWVVGLEADFQGALERDSSTLTNIFNGVVSLTGPPPRGLNFDVNVTGSRVLDYQTKIDWFGTARVRLGYVWGNGEVMSYVTGGLAYGEVKINGTNTVSGQTDFGPTPFVVTEAFGHAQVNTGWVVGTGTEGKLLIPGWTYKIETLYMDLGTLDASGSGVSPSTHVDGETNSATGQITMHSHFTDTILRAGLNYQFH